MNSKKVQKETNAGVLRQAMLKRIPRRITGQGQITLPAIPALLDHYVQTLSTIFQSYGRIFTEVELTAVRGILETKLNEGFKASPYSKITVNFHTDPPPSTALSYTVSQSVVTIADEYEYWVQSRQPPLFGAHPDSKLMELARSLGAPEEVPVLDIGAGTGRNTLPLAEAGFPTDAVELAPALAKVLREDIEKRKLASRVFEGNVLDGSLDVPKNHYRLIIAAEVIASHCRGVGEIRQLFERAAELLVPGGLLLFNMFLTSGGYKPDTLARELSETMWCCLFTRREVEEAVEGLPLTQLSDESVYEFEHEHLPKEAWPPTGWFEEWTRGQDLFDISPEKSPSELRWLVYRRA